jgi:hypothetical protein
VLAAAAAIVFAGAGFVQAAPGPNGHNDHGLCTAYFNGQKVGHGPGENTDDPPPFQGLENVSRTYTDHDGVDNDNDGQIDESGENSSLTDAENIYNYCGDGGLIGGNPEHGRFTCGDGLTSDGSDQQTNPECNRNPKPGNG